MLLTDCLEPQVSQVTKKIRLSLVSNVSGDLHVLQVTYSTVEHEQGGRQYEGQIIQR